MDLIGRCIKTPPRAICTILITFLLGSIVGWVIGHADQLDQISQLKRLQFPEGISPDVAERVRLRTRIKSLERENLKLKGVVDANERNIGDAVTQASRH